MINYKNEYLNSILAYISYANMNGSSDNINGVLVEWDNLKEVDLSTPLNKQRFIDNFNKYLNNKGAINEIDNALYSLNFFTENFIILDQKVERGFNGFSVTKYQLKKLIPGTDFVVGQVFLSYRGTEITWADGFTDVQLAFSHEGQTGPTTTFVNNLIHRKSQELEAQEYLKKAIDDHTTVYLNGHSLGGYLATRAFLYSDQDTQPNGKKYSDGVIGVTTFNGAGFGFWGGFLGEHPTLRQKVTNFYSARGINFTTSDFREGDISFFEHLGARIPTYTEKFSNPMENHGMALLLNSLGVMSILDIIVDYPASIIDAENKTLLADRVKFYTIDKLLMGSVALQNDIGVGLDTFLTKLIKSFNIDNIIDPVTGVSILPYESSISNFISLESYFKSNSDLKIKLIENSTYTDNEVDSNYNRALMRALVDDISYQVIVPDTANYGIFERTKTVNGQIVKINETYNIENYTKEYLDYRTVFNKASSYILEKKLFDGFPPTIEDETLILEGVFSKFAFIDQLISNNSNDTKTFFVNTTRGEVNIGEVPCIYFKNNKLGTFNIFNNNGFVFDTVKDENTSGDFISVFSNNCIVHSMHGHDVISFNNNATGSIFFVDKNTQTTTLNNENDAIQSLTIKTENFTLSEIIIKNINYNFTNKKEYKTELRLGDSIITLLGVADIQGTDTIYDFDKVINIISSFKENFNNEGSNLIIDEEFIDRYIHNTFINFQLTSIKNTSNPINYFEFISQQHADYIIASLNYYKKNSSLFVDIDDLIIYVNSKIIDTNIDNTIHPSVQHIIPIINNSVNNFELKNDISIILNNFITDNYANMETITEFDNSLKHYINNNYYKKETKNYNEVTTDKTTTYVWDGLYYNNRMKNGVQISAFYNSNFEGEIINYYKNNIYVNLKDQSTAINKTKSVNNINISKPLYGSDQSDILIGQDVFGQSDYYGISGSVVIVPAGGNANGNDILMGDNVTSYSGDNLIIGTKSINGGSGNDIMIATGSLMTIYFNHQYSNDLSTVDNINYLMGTYNGAVYSSNARNYILNSETDLSSGLVNIYSTGNDIILGGSQKIDFIGGNKALLNFKNRIIQDDEFSYFQEPLNNFYSYYPVNNNKNKIYLGTGSIQAILSENDFIDLRLGKGTVWGSGYNEIITGNNSYVYSGGHSTINLLGNNTTIFLGKDDTFDTKNSENNLIYTSNYRENTISSTDINSYLITGIENKLFLGIESYEINLEGYSSTITFDKPNINNQIINIKEKGDSVININIPNINKLSIFNELNNEFSLAISSLPLQDAFNINELNIKTKSDFFFNKILDTTKFNTVNIETNNKFLIYSTEIEHINVGIDSFNKGDITISDSVIKSIRSISYSYTSNNLNILEFLDIKAFLVNLSYINAKNIKIEGDDIVANPLYDVDNININGVISYLFLEGSEYGANVYIDGYIEAAYFSNIKSFNYIERSRVILSNSTSTYNVINISNSTLEDSINMLKESYISLDNSNISDIDLNGVSYNIVANNSTIDKLSIQTTDTFYLFTDSVIANGNISTKKGLLTWTNGQSITIMESQTIEQKNETRLTINSANTLSISGNYELDLGNVQNLYLLNGEILIMNIVNIENLNINIDKVSLTLTYYDSILSNNIILESNSTVRLSKISNLYSFNEIKLANIPNIININGTLYTKQKLELIFNNLSSYNDYAIITDLGIYYFGFGVPINEEIINTPIEGFPFYDTNNIYNGTINNDIFTLKERKSYHLRGNGGDDTYIFTVPNDYENILDYSSTDGIATIIGSDLNINPLKLRINLIGINISDINFKYETSGYNYSGRLNIYNGTSLIIIIENYNKINVNLFSPNGSLTKDTIQKGLFSVYGTNNNDVLISNDNTDTYFYPGIGDDIITIFNFTFGLNNNIYYNLGDGYKLINAPSYTYNIIFDNLIDKNLFTYTKEPNDILNILLNNEIIIQIKSNAQGTLNFTKDNSIVTTSSILKVLNTVRGTSGNDIIDALPGSFIYSGTGYDIINVNYNQLDPSSTIYYNKGEDRTDVVLSDTIINCANLVLDSLFMNLNNIKFEYDVYKHDDLNIYYKENDVYTKIIKIVNYNRLSTGRMTINIGIGLLSHSFQIHPLAEANYQLALEELNN